MLKSNKVSVYVVLCACLLIVIGDVRFIIGSVGYWALWLIVVLTGFFLSSSKFERTVSAELFVYIVGFLLLVTSFVLSGIANQDLYTIYQGLKIFFIALTFFCLYVNVYSLSNEDVYYVSKTAIAVGLFLFLISKYMFRDWYVELGDGRQGSYFAYPGVLWKTPVFFIGFVISGMIFAVGNKISSLLIILGGVFLMMADSSRTGFLIFSMVALLFFLICAYSKPKFIIIGSLIMIFIGVGLLLLYSGGFVHLSQVDDPLVLNRLAEGDPTRTKMFADGVLHAMNCFPLGCGFGTSTSLVDGDYMVVHNAYLSSLGDLGVLGFIGLTVLMCSPVIFFLGKLISFKNKSSVNLVYSIAAFGGVSGYGLLMMLHPFSTELSEWGIWILMVSMLSTFSRRMVIRSDKVKANA